MPAGYSGTPLLKKLGIRDNFKIMLINAPKNYFDLMEADISNQLSGKNETSDLVHLFVASKKEFITAMKQLKTTCRKNSNITIWVSWYKKSSGIPTDMTEDIIREYALQNGLVDVKVCAVSEEWSGLKLIVPLSKR